MPLGLSDLGDHDLAPLIVDRQVVGLLQIRGRLLHDRLSLGEEAVDRRIAVRELKQLRRDSVGVVDVHEIVSTYEAYQHTVDLADASAEIRRNRIRQADRLF